MYELCKREKIERKTYLHILKTCRIRNETVHKAIPRLEDYLDKDENLSWDGVWAACDKRKKDAAKQWKKKRLTDDQLKEFKETIDTWFKAHVNGWTEDDKPILGYGVEKMLTKLRSQHRCKLNRLPQEIPDSPYQEGKWDDLFKDGSSAIGFCR